MSMASVANTGMEKQGAGGRRGDGEQGSENGTDGEFRRKTARTANAKLMLGVSGCVVRCRFLSTKPLYVVDFHM